MATAFIFAGADALDLPASRILSLRLGTVRDRLRAASAVWARFSGDKSPLEEFLASADPPFHACFTRKAICCAAVQAGLFDKLAARGPRPDYLLGCSLGDIARTVCAGACSLEEAVAGLALFGKAGESILNGAILQLTFAKAPSRRDLRALEEKGVRVAVFQTPTRIAVSGPERAIQDLSRRCEGGKGVRARYLYGKPLHSPWMEPAANAVREHLARRGRTDWDIPMISSTRPGLIRTGRHLRDDLERNMTQAIYWHQAIQMAVRRFGIRKLVNIGPCTTLLSFLSRIPLPAGVELFDCGEEAA